MKIRRFWLFALAALLCSFGSSNALTASTLTDYRGGSGDPTLVYGCSASESSWCGPSQLLPVIPGSSTAFWAIGSSNPVYVYKDSSGEWKWEPLQWPTDEVIPSLSGTCTTISTTDGANTLICGVLSSLYTSSSAGPKFGRRVEISGSPPDHTPFYNYASLSLGGSRFAMYASAGRARYVVLGSVNLEGRSAFITSTWVSYPPSQACLSMTRRTTSTSDTLLLGCTNAVFAIPLDSAFTTSKTSSSSAAVEYPIGTGIYSSITYSPTDDYLYLGSLNGIGFQVNAATMRISRLFFIPESSRSAITSIVVDTTSLTPNIYWAALNGAIYRTSPTNLNPLDSLDLSLTLFDNTPLKIAQMIPAPGENGKLLVSAAALGYEGNPNDQDTAALIEVLKTDCASLKCSQCVADSYCSYCYSTGSCLTSESCPATETANTTAQCPSISSTSPTRLAVTGGAYWTAYLTALKTGLVASDYRCVFKLSNTSFSSSKTVTASKIDVEARTVSCYAPQFPAEIYSYGTAYSGSTYIAFKKGGSVIAWTPTSRKFNYYNCLTRLGQCATSTIDCGWCFSTATCTSPNDTFCPATDSTLKNATAGYRPLAMTAITSISPSIVSIAYTGRITVNVTQFPVFADSNKQLLCVSNSNRTSVATPTIDPENPNFYKSFSCALPNVLLPTSSKTRTLAFSIYTGPARQIPLSSTLASISVFNCALRTNCLECLDPILETGCTWCPTSRKCFDPSLKPGSETCTQTNTTCPIITETNPTLATITSFNSNSLQVAVLGKGFTSAPSLSCYWTLPSIGSYYSTASVANDTHATCMSQGPVSVPGMWNFGLNVSATASLAPAVPFNIYDCQSYTNCGDCVSYPGITCEWCNSPGKSACMDLGASTSCPSSSLITPDLATQCPNLLTTDPLSLILGLASTTDVTLTGEHMNFPDQSSVESKLRCGLTPYDAAGTASSGEVLYNTQYENSEAVICADVAIPSSGAYAMIRLVDTVTSKSAAAAVNISVVDCATFSDCPTCLEAGCILCAGNCSGSCSSEDIKQAVCPEFSEVTPEYSDLAAQTSITVKASGLLATFSSSTGSMNTRSASRSYDSHADSDLINIRNALKLELSTLTWKQSRNRISRLLKQLESVEHEIQVSIIQSEAASQVLLAEIENSQATTGDKAIERRNSAALPTLPYTCSWDDDEVTPAQYSAPDTIICESPTSGLARNVSLAIYLGDVPYLNVPQVFELITCPSVSPILTDGTASCNPECTANEDPLDQRCGWCALSGTCTSPALCPIPTDIWQSSCSVIGLSVLGSNYEGGHSLNINMSVPLPAYVDTRNLTCSFAGIYTPANVSTIDSQTMDITSVSCLIPRSPAPEGSTRTVTVPVAVQYNARSVTSTAAFSYVNCKAFTKCNDCTARPLCGWCSTNKKCTMDYECSSSAWTRKECPLDTLAIGLGVGLGLVALILLVGLLVFLLVRAHRRRTGLVIVMEEPNYDAIAWGNDIRLLYRLPKSRWSVLEQALQRTDFVLQLGLSFNCPATEQDALAKGLVYVACAHGMATDMIKTIIRAEVQACALENQLFRSNSVASKMYKFFSRIVGVKYLYHCIARMVMELEVLGRRAIVAAHANTKGKNANGSGSSLGSGDSGSVSILDVSLELDLSKDGGRSDDVDAEINRLQLQLICQKILTVLSKKTLRNIPKPLREIFVEIDRSVSSKFPGSNEAIYKGLGGLFFLRFVCPALTAPHVYGLLQAPPNDATQRQLVLIAKVIQSIANMQTQTQKEDYMEKMGSFINKSIPRIQRFYDNLREAANIHTASSIYERIVVVPDEVRQNGLAAVQAILVPQAAKIQAWDSASVLSEPQQADLTRIIDECLESDDHIPKKAKQA